ncbi:hypothetical protein RB601_004330 [Gaeumannomyces tritici]
MPVVHVVLMAFEPLATPQETDKIVQSMLALKDKCIHPATQKPYVKSTKGGANLTSDGFAVRHHCPPPSQTHAILCPPKTLLTRRDSQEGYSHSFVMEFETGEECAYYSDEDPVHLEFIESTSGIVSKTLVVDFTPGVF